MRRILNLHFFLTGDIKMKKLAILSILGLALSVCACGEDEVFNVSCNNGQCTCEGNGQQCYSYECGKMLICTNSVVSYKEDSSCDCN